MKTLSVKAKVTPDCSGVTFSNPYITGPQLFGKAGQEVDVTLIFGKVPRSAAQNRYLWGVVYPVLQKQLLEITGEHFEPAELHTYNLQKIQGKKMEWKSIAGVEVLFIEDKKSSDMTVEEFSIMVENIIQYAATTWGIVIPPPIGDNSLDHLLNR